VKIKIISKIWVLVLVGLLSACATQEPKVDGWSFIVQDKREVVNIRLGILFFDFDESNIKTSTKENLDKIVTLLLSNDFFDIEIHGHCDNRGTDEYNMILGGKRASVVANYLLACGINAKDIRVISHGAKQSFSNFHWQNRRVEIIAKTRNAIKGT